MRVKVMGKHRVLLTMTDMTFILFSYEIPVAGYRPQLGYFKTAHHFSKITEQHIEHFLRGVEEVTILPQLDIENLLSD